MADPFAIELAPPFLVVTFQREQRVLSWSLLRPGWQMAKRIVWLEVRNRDLPCDVDPMDVVRARVSAASLDDAVVLVTSRDIGSYRGAHASVEASAAWCVTTLGLSNSERVGMRLHQPPPFAGTINTLVHVNEALSEPAMIEALSIATEARTAAVLDAEVRRGGYLVTGTGTDCIAIAAPPDDPGASYAGKHTAIGEAIGAAVYKATADAISDWKRDCAELRDAMEAKAASG